MKSLLKGGILAAVMGLSLTTAAQANDATALPTAEAPMLIAMDPAMMEVSPDDPMFDAMILQELRRLNDEIQALSAFGMTSEDEELQELATMMFEESMSMDEMISELRQRTLMREANSNR